MNQFKLGDRTKDVWAGDLVSECEYIADLGYGTMLFYDIKFKCFRKVFWHRLEDGKFILNGWNCANCPSELLLDNS